MTNYISMYCRALRGFLLSFSFIRRLYVFRKSHFISCLLMLVCVVEQRALAFTPQQYVVAERHTGNVRFTYFINIYTHLTDDHYCLLGVPLMHETRQLVSSRRTESNGMSNLPFSFHCQAHVDRLHLFRCSTSEISWS